MGVEKVVEREKSGLRWVMMGGKCGWKFFEKIISYYE